MTYSKVVRCCFACRISMLALTGGSNAVGTIPDMGKQNQF